MADNKKKLLQLLIALAWADGKVDEEEMEVVEAMIDEFGVSKEIADEVRQWAKTPRSLDDIDIKDLEPSDAELVLSQAVVLTFIDGEQSQKEIDLLATFVGKLGLSKENADEIIATATERVKDFLPLLQE